MTNTYKCALGGIISALALTIMVSAAIIPFLTYILPAISGALTLVIVKKCGSRWAFGVYSAVAILAIFLVPDKEIAVMYLAFFGYYPILKLFCEKHIKKFPALLVKTGAFVVTMVVSYYLMIRLMGLTIDETEEWGIYAYPILLSMGTAAFWMYDFVLTKVQALDFRF